ncbi:hypothetical protein HYH02_003364 [Chlamydomonas schloesseri]|uniref:Glycosyl transferase CAP10 domain-containing protein n=1 Tax=Chlamydomonas schloesseri TaxID=2026947 RepID=A0A835WTM6_9CHLO|nr:hypothetical protein HYH02_003364 [Chlamydomonas schloesseri]|eukprot:KAG2452340.1 hypothetical protein HYH02_003364 [Chlamydomonas schloesseri]
MKQHFLPAVFKVVLIYKMDAFFKQLQPLLDRGDVQMPDAVFTFNVEDNQPRWCGPSANCTVPLLSIIKTVDEASGNDTDILIPQFLYLAKSTYHYPWHLKKDVAFFRGTPFCSSWWADKFDSKCTAPCTRAWLAYLSMQDEQQGRGQSVLDVALVVPYEGSSSCITQKPPVKKHLPLANHTYYKYLLHLEGHTTSFRLGMLFHTNSLVLYQNQPFLGHYTRSLRPHVHYVPFWNTTPRGQGMEDIYDVMQAVRHKDSVFPQDIQHIIREAQQFAVKFLSLSARARYLRDALLAYKSLFEDMDPFIEQLVARMRERGFRIPHYDVCNSAVAHGSATAGARKRDSATGHKQQHHSQHQQRLLQHQQHEQSLQLLGSPQGWRARAYHEHITAFVTAAGAAAGARALTATASDAARAFDDLATSNDHLAPLATLGLADAATPPRLRMLERTPSGGVDSDPASRAGSAGGGGGGAAAYGRCRGSAAAAKRAMAVSARHIAHGGYVAGRVLLTRALLPAARAGCAAGCAVATATAAAAVATGRAVAGAAGGVIRFASAPRVRVVGFDGEQEAAAGAGGAQALALAAPAAAPEPISNLVGARIRLAGCRATRLRVEYCRDCVLVATGLRDCELLLVGCSRLRLVLRGCAGLVLRELQCSDMGDCVRRRCERFSHEIVCLRCACKPLSGGGGGGGGGWGLGAGGAFGPEQQVHMHLQPHQHQQHQPEPHQQHQHYQLSPQLSHRHHHQHQQHQHQHPQIQQLLHRYNSVSSSVSSSAAFQGNGNWQ